MSTSIVLSVFHIKNSSLDQALHMQEILCLIGEYLTWVGRIDLGLACKEFYAALTVIKHLRLNEQHSLWFIDRPDFRLRVSACVKDPMAQIDGNYLLFLYYNQQTVGPKIYVPKHHYDFNRFAIDDRIVDLSLLPDDDPFPFNHDNGGQPIIVSDSDSDSDDSEDNSDASDEEEEEEEDNDDLSPSQLAEIDEEIIAICINIDGPVDTV